MNHKNIIVLHENGADPHYRALQYLCNKKETTVIYREFSITKSILKSLIRAKPNLFKKQILNIIFMFNLLFTKNKTILLGIAPYDFRLVLLSLILKNHKVFYHTSWICWDQSFYPQKLFANKYLISFWEGYISKKIIKIFAVSKSTQSELIKNLDISEEKIIVVNHSFDPSIYKYKARKLALNFLYVGRLEQQKGILEILDYFSKNNSVNLTLVGDGSLLPRVQEHSSKYQNIKHIDFISDQKKLSEVYNENDYLLLNSKKEGTWEELFGMVLIEAMACGVIPIATNHKGPTEVITNAVNGFISEEDNFINTLDNLIKSHKAAKGTCETIRLNAIIAAKKYSTEEISKRWESIFE